MTTRTGICLIALALALVLWKLKKQPKAHAVAAFVAVSGLLTGAVGGWLPKVALWVFHWLVLLENWLTGVLFGGADPGVVFSIVAAVFVGLVIHDLWPKHSAKRSTVILAALAPFFMLAAGNQWAAVIHGNLNGVTSTPAVTVTVTSATSAYPAIGR